MILSPLWRRLRPALTRQADQAGKKLPTRAAPVPTDRGPNQSALIGIKKRSKKAMGNFKPPMPQLIDRVGRRPR